MQTAVVTIGPTEWAAIIVYDDGYREIRRGTDPAELARWAAKCEQEDFVNRFFGID